MTGKIEIREMVSADFVWYEIFVNNTYLTKASTFKEAERKAWAYAIR